MPRRKAPSFDRQRAAIRDAAAQVFAERGFATATLTHLAAAGGVSKALVYHYYRNKEEVLFDVADSYIDRLIAIVDETAAERLKPRLQLARLIARFMDEYRHSAARHRVLVQDVKHLSRPRRARIVAKQRRVVQGVADAVAAVAPRLAGSALLKPVTMTLFGMINWTFTWLKDQGPLTYADMAPVVTALFLQGVGKLGRA